MNNFNRNIALIAIIFSVFIIGPVNAFQRELPFIDPDKTISMDLQDATLKDVLKIFSIQSELNFIAAESAENRKVTLYLNNVPVKDAMEKLFMANNLIYDVDNDSSIIIVKNLDKTKIPVVTRIFPLKNAHVSNAMIKDGLSESSSSASSGGSGSSGTAAGIANTIKSLLTSAGTIAEDARTNSLVITDIPERLDEVGTVIAKMDIPQPMVLLEVEMLDVNKGATEKLGLTYPQDGNPFFAMTVDYSTGPQYASTFPFGNLFPKRGFRSDPTNAKGATAGTYGTTKWNGDSFKLQFDFIKTATDAKSLARPKILTLNNYTAEIKIATKEAIGLQSQQTSVGTSGSSTTTSAERTDTGVSLKVTPQINTDTGEITMAIIPSVSEAKASDLATSTNPLKDPETRTTKSILRVKDGETIIIGGLIRDEISNGKSGLPFLSDIPVVGALFRERHKDQDAQRELLVFITPHIVNNSYGDVSKKITLLDREQGTASAGNKVSAIEETLDTLEKRK